VGESRWRTTNPAVAISTSNGSYESRNISSVGSLHSLGVDTHSGAESTFQWTDDIPRFEAAIHR